jgi:hypothetical protein
MRMDIYLRLSAVASFSDVHSLENSQERRILFPPTLATLSLAISVQEHQNAHRTYIANYASNRKLPRDYQEVQVRWKALAYLSLFADTTFVVDRTS